MAEYRGHLLTPAESALARRQHDKGYLSPLIADMAKEADKAVAIMAPKLEDFSDLYSKQEIAADKAYVAKMEGMFKRDDNGSKQIETQKKYARVMEAFIQQYAGTCGWFGEGGQVSFASRYDDVKNRTDLILSLPRAEGEELLRIAVDATFSEEEALKKIREEVESLKNSEKGLTTVKYFEDEMTGEQGARRMPRVVLGMEVEHVTELAGLWKNNKVETLSAHQVQEMFLREALSQINYYLDELVMSEEPPFLEIKKALKETRLVLQGIRNKKRSQMEKSGRSYISFDNPGDRVADVINNLQLTRNPDPAKVHTIHK